MSAADDIKQAEESLTKHGVLPEIDGLVFDGKRVRTKSQRAKDEKQAEKEAAEREEAARKAAEQAGNQS